MTTFGNFCSTAFHIPVVSTIFWNILTFYQIIKDESCFMILTHYRISIINSFGILTRAINSNRSSCCVHTHYLSFSGKSCRNLHHINGITFCIIYLLLEFKHSIFIVDIISIKVEEVTYKIITLAVFTICNWIFIRRSWRSWRSWRSYTTFWRISGRTVIIVILIISYFKTTTFWILIPFTRITIIKNNTSIGKCTRPQINSPCYHFVIIDHWCRIIRVEARPPMICRDWLLRVIIINISIILCPFIFINKMDGNTLCHHFQWYAH